MLSSILSLLASVFAWFIDRKKDPDDALRKEAEDFSHPDDNDDSVIRKL